MCIPIICHTCGKITYAGCGDHAERLMAKVPAELKCRCQGCPADRMDVDAAAAPHGGDPVSIKHADNPKEFQQELTAAGGRLVVVDYFAQWCGPCKMMAPKFEALSRVHADVVFLKVDGDKCPECVESMGVTAFPSFLFYKCGKQVAEVVGVNEAALRKAIEANK